MKPTPETKHAVLWSDAAKDFTLHSFVETNEVEEAYEFVFECTVTGQRRRWGLQRIPEVN